MHVEGLTSDAALLLVLLAVVVFIGCAPVARVPRETTTTSKRRYYLYVSSFRVEAGDCSNSAAVRRRVATLRERDAKSAAEADDDEQPPSSEDRTRCVRAQLQKKIPPGVAILCAGDDVELVRRTWHTTTKRPDLRHSLLNESATPTTAK